MKKSFLTTRSGLITEVSQGTSVIWEKLYKTVQSFTVLPKAELCSHLRTWHPGVGSASHLLAAFEVLWIPPICWAARSIPFVLASLWLLFWVELLNNIAALEENLLPLSLCMQMCLLSSMGLMLSL